MRVLAGVVLSIALMGAANADPLAEARSGKLQCYRPDAARKTCAALASYNIQTSGITNTAEVLLSAQPLLVMRTSSPVVVKGEAVCGIVHEQDINGAELTLNGAKLPDDQANPIRAQLVAAMRGEMGKEVCSTYIPTGDRFSAQVTIEGSANPTLTQEVVWVKPDEGYRVAP